MLGKLFAALKNLFSSLFGSSKSPTDQPTTTSNTKPGTPTRPSTSSSGGTTSTTAQTSTPQDASELKPDTVIIVAHEMDKVVLLPNEPDHDFDDNIFEDEPPVDIEPEAEPTPAPAPAPPPAPTPSGRQPRFLWCLDNGHGSQTPGKRSPVFDDGETQFFEYEFNRDIVRRIIEKLKKEGVQYYNVVPEVDIDNFLQGRVERANKKSSSLPKIYVSIHSNAAPAQSSKHWAADNIKGIETWYFHGSKKGQKLASIFQRHLIEFTGFNNRHLKSQPDRQFYVLRKTMMPSVLTENGFYNNKREAQQLMKDSVRQQIADAHVAAILELEENGF
jgi:N-acetylmuramoyl-L-alanine amidase